jgi:BEN domain
MLKNIPYETVGLFVSKLLGELYNEETLGTHSLSGMKSNRHQEGETIRAGLPTDQLKQIIG